MDLGMDVLWKEAALKERYLLIFEINTYKNLAQVSPVSIQDPFHGLQMASVVLAYSTGQRCHLISCELLPHETTAGK